MKKKILTLFLTGSVLFSIAGCGKNSTDETSAEPKIVKIAATQSNGLLGELSGIAQEKKYIEEELEKINYKPEYVGFAGAGPAINEAFVAKNIDFANYGDLPAVVLKSKGIGVSVIAVSNPIINYSVVVQKDSDIKTISDLKGKKVIVPKGTVIQYYFEQLLKANNVNSNDVKPINAVADAQSVFASKEADAIAYVDSFSRVLVQKDLGEILPASTTEDHPDWTSQFIFAGRDEYMKENPEVAVALLKAHIRAKEFVDNNPDESFQIISKGGLPLDIVTEIYSTKGGKFENYNIEITDDSIKRLKDLNDFLLSQKLISTSAKIDEFIDVSYYEKALKELKN